jgi:hypothetical protein
MPFTAVNNFPNPQNTLLTVTISGQLLIQPLLLSPNTTGCEIVVNDQAVEHELSIILVTITPNQPLEVLRIHTGALHGRFNISAGAPGVNIYQQNQPFTRDHEHDDPKDIRWAVSLSHLYPPGLKSVENPTRRSVIVETGVLYSNHLTDPNHFNPHIRCQNGATRPMVSIASDVAAAVGVAGGTATLQWLDKGNAIHERPLSQQVPDRRYLLAITNEPQTYDQLLHDELRHFYKILRKPDGSSVIERDQCTLIQGTGVLTNPEIPCMPLVDDDPNH